MAWKRAILIPVVLCSVSAPAAWQSQRPAEALRSRVEALRAAPATRIRGIQLMQPRAVVAFYEARGFQPAWALPAGAATIVQAIRRTQEDGLTPADYHLAALDSAIAARGSAANPELDADLQVLLADATAALFDHVLYGKVLPATLDKRWNVDPRIGAPPMESVLNQLATAPALGDAINALQPKHFIYTGLKKELARLRTVASAGSWPVVPPGRASIKPGAKDPRVPAVRKRLAASGELASNASPESDVYDAELEAALKRFQDHHRLNADGAIGKTTLDALNVPIDTRIGQVRVNMERARWVTNGLRESFLLVNLPAFKVYFIRDGKNIWESKTQIGRAARRTPTFRADLRYLVFNPDWTVPPTILEQDVLGGMRKGQNTIAKKRLTILDRQGNAVDPASIDWATARPGTFPYTLRQPPGPDNALGRVKFIFPNQYLHLPARYAKPRSVLVGPADVQLRVHPRREAARSGDGAPRGRRLEPRARPVGRGRRADRDRPAA